MLPLDDSVQQQSSLPLGVSVLQQYVLHLKVAFLQQAGILASWPVLLNVYGAPELIPRNEFRPIPPRCLTPIDFLLPLCPCFQFFFGFVRIGFFASNLSFL
jgi:hypothetical protein